MGRLWPTLLILGAGSLPARAAPEGPPITERWAIWAPRAPDLARAVASAIPAEAVERAVDPDEAELWFGARAPVPPSPPLAEIKQAVDRARRAFQRFRLDETAKNLSAADEGLAAWRGLPEALDLERDVLSDQVSLAHAERDESRLEQALARFAARFPGEGPPPKSAWPPALTERLARQAEPRPATLIVRANAPAARVWIDGRPLGTAPLTLTQLGAGTHRVVLEAERTIRFDQTLLLSPQETKELECKLRPDLGPALAKADLHRPLPPALLDRVRSVLAAARLDGVILADSGPTEVVLLALRPSGTLGEGRADSPEPALLRAAFLGAVGRGGSALGAPPWWSYAALGTGVALTAFGVGFRAAAGGLEGDFLQNHASFTQVAAAERLDAIDSNAARGTALLVTGAAVILGAAGFMTYRLLAGDPTP
ncbi:MAG: PEGA domain-containing protein [Myxococcota bacterium]